MAHKPPSWISTVDEMDDHEFQQWSHLLKQRTGMEVKLARKSFLTTGVKLRMRELGFSSYNEYYHFLLDGRNGKVEWATLVDRLTIHETRFYRHPQSIQLLTDEFLPNYLKQHSDKNNILAWSVGCATGEESYSLAMAMDDYLQRHFNNIYFGIVGSDISLPAISKARKGIYDFRRLKNLPAEFFERYLTEQDSGQYQITGSLRKRVCFNMLNLLEMEQNTINEVDIIFCQNVLIYFDMKMRHTILNQLVENLMPGGLLMLGVGEAMEWKHPQMKRLKGYDALAFTKESYNAKE